MAHQAYISPTDIGRQDDLRLLPEWETSTWQSLKENVRDFLFPEKLPPLKLTSRPVKVRDIWAESRFKKRSLFGSLLVHGTFAGLIALATILTRWELAPDGEDRDTRHNIGMGPQNGAPLRVRGRRQIARSGG